MVAKTVLVVEDDPCIRIVAEEMFAAAGIEVESVQRADHALAIVAQRSEQTALLFTDVQTPGPIDGIDLARLVKTHWPHVEVLVTSGRPVSNIVLPDGVRFTSKPWSRKDVLKLARAAVAERVTEGSVALASLRRNLRLCCIGGDRAQFAPPVSPSQAVDSSNRAKARDSAPARRAALTERETGGSAYAYPTDFSTMTPA
jgi:DNA-binding NtrC family response regulator